MKDGTNKSSKEKKSSVAANHNYMILNNIMKAIGNLML